jgi:hypothetical protein
VCRRRCGVCGLRSSCRVDALAGGRDVRGGLDALGLQDSGGRLGVAAFGFPDQAPQEPVELVEDRVLLPGGEVAVDGLPRGEVVRQVPLGDPGPVNVKHRVHDPPQVVSEAGLTPGRTPRPAVRPGHDRSSCVFE